MMKRIILISLLVLTNLFALSDQEIKDAYYKSYNYEKMGNYTDAIKAIMPVYNDYPETYTVNLRLGWLYYLNENYANSLEHYGKAIKISPYSLEAKLGELLPLLARERYGEVEKKAFQILDADYYNYYGNLRLVFALRMQQKSDLAEKIALKMLAIYPIDVSFLTEYALIKFAQGEKDTAFKLFYDILILDPENVTAKSYIQ
jgi:tetratricopeptide (TPR) repeat protein